MPHLNPTPKDKLVDEAGRPYFLWDVDLDVREFEDRLRSEDPAVRAYFMGKLMRQAKPDDVFSFVTLRDIRALWGEIEPYLGSKLEFWRWLLKMWDEASDGAR